MIGLLKRRRRQKLSQAEFPKQWREILRQQFPIYLRLSAADRRELDSHILVFLAEKRFEGCQGVVITDEMRVMIAAQACLLLLHRPGNYYGQLRTILVYPSTYVAPYKVPGAAGVIHEHTRILLGESWQQGAVVLAWDSVQAGAANAGDGHNVVFHEFAHQLDHEDGVTDGAPLLAEGEPLRRRAAVYSSWTKVMAAEYEHFRNEIKKGHKTVLDPYGATNPAEFFAVATECFFEKPKQLLEHQPALYSELVKFYRQNPAEWHHEVACTTNSCEFVKFV